MGWGDGWGDWSATGRRRAPRRPVSFERVVFQHAVTRHESTLPEIVDRVREKLADSAKHWCETHGYLPGTASWETVPNDSFETVTFRLTVEVVPRTDGEWPAIHEAIREDAADREQATEHHTDVSDRLDALRDAASWWSDPKYR